MRQGYIALFISNAKGVHASFSKESKKYLLDFYLTKRKSKSDNLFSTRQLNSLIRLSLAEARCHFSNTVTTQHVKNVIEIWYIFLDYCVGPLRQEQVRKEKHQNRHYQAV